MSKRNLWTNEETKLMLDIIKDNMYIKERGGMSRNNTKLFKTVEEEMVEAGYCMKDFHQIGVKWKNMKCAYFTSKKAVAENLERKELIPFYEEMEEILEMNYSTASDESNCFDYKLYNSENNDGTEHAAPIMNDTAIIHKTDWSNNQELTRKLLQKQGTAKLHEKKSLYS